MRRLVFILLLALLPLQSIWAAAASYCTHEAVPAAAHFGHHAHQQHGDDANAGHAQNAAKSLAQGQVDLDCHTCHSLGNALGLQVTHVFLRIASAPPAPWAQPAWQHPSPLRPERPRWQRLA